MIKKKKPDEKTVIAFIKRRMAQEGLTSDRIKCIVAFGSNSAVPHYKQDSNKALEENTLVLIDCWGRLREKDSLYADLTKVAYFGRKIPRDVAETFSLVRKARDTAVSFIESSLSSGKIPYPKQVDHAARRIISARGFGKNFIHTTGHSLGTADVHGNIRFSRKTKRKLEQRTAYTIEPGIYLKGKFGIRSEIDIMVAENRVIRTSPFQEKLPLIGF
jgi:Xaa-Pro aminopeptidase